ncbi:hypothetical protein J4541_25880, partial [Klebsiella pneumoniae]|uniref:hypothetical protein n=1 Tax=Klebsiella pneumoniae TaxID=573 RepID=UPI0020054FFE
EIVIRDRCMFATTATNGMDKESKAIGSLLIAMKLLKPSLSNRGECPSQENIPKYIAENTGILSDCLNKY